MVDSLADMPKPIQLAPDRPKRMLAAYQANLDLGLETVRRLILEDIRRFSDLGAAAYVDDLQAALPGFDEEAFLNACPNPAGQTFSSLTH